ncbi:MAG TPA: guanylate kinase [Candidatus Marinimicrobia bacterium]|nr:guanylate kinase [Candidatus Neomarinimicrobiota bacterium]
MSAKGLLLPIAAPSGTGKTTVCRHLIKNDDRFVFSVSATTRAPRKSEQEGVDYTFLSRDTFEKYIRENKLAEWEEVFGNYYGTLRSVVSNTLDMGKILLLDIDVKGALRIKRLYPDDTVSIFLLPPNQAELLRRLKGRGTDDEKSIAIRNARIPDEIKLGKQFDYQIVNNQLSETLRKIRIIIEEYWKK